MPVARTILNSFAHVDAGWDHTRSRAPAAPGRPPSRPQSEDTLVPAAFARYDPIVARTRDRESACGARRLEKQPLLIQPTPDDAVALVHRFLARGKAPSPPAGGVVSDADYAEEAGGDAEPAAGDEQGEEEADSDADSAFDSGKSGLLAPLDKDHAPILRSEQEVALARGISEAMNRAIVDFSMKHDLAPQQVRRALMHSALEILRNCVDLE